MCSGMANPFKYGICDQTRHWYQQDMWNHYIIEPTLLYIPKILSVIKHAVQKLSAYTLKKKHSVVPVLK